MVARFLARLTFCRHHLGPFPIQRVVYDLGLLRPSLSGPALDNRTFLGQYAVLGFAPVAGLSGARLN